MRRVMSLWLPSWPVERRRRSSASRSASWDRPVLVADWAGGRGIVTAVDPRLIDSLAPGMGLADARAIVPEARVLDADPAGDAAALVRLADWCGRYSPWTAPDQPDGLWLDLTGAAHLRGGEHVLAEELVGRIERFGFSVRAAIAETPGAAWALAREGNAKITVVPEGATRVALALLPVRGLRLAPETAEMLDRLGLRRIGDLYRLSRPALVARFGFAIAERLDQALGLQAEPLSPLPPAPVRSSHRRFAEPILQPEALAAAIASLSEALCRHLAEAGAGARRLALNFYRLDGTVLVLEAGTAQASRDPRHLARLFAERLDRIDPGLGIEDMRLTALLVEPLGSEQALLDRNATHASADATLAALVDRLENRLGAGAVGRYRPRDSHLPERAAERVPALATGAGGTPWNPEHPRPIRLLPHPEPIEATAPIPDDPPVQFRWRRRVHRVRAADGPERILGEWWRDAREAVPRDYYCVEDEEGRRFWLYRAGLHEGSVSPRWFLHGFFG